MKRILCIMAVVVVLFTALIVPTSAYQAQSPYLWEYETLSSTGTANEVVTGEIILPFIFYDTYNDASLTAKRHYQYYYESIDVDDTNDSYLIGANAHDYEGMSNSYLADESGLGRYGLKYYTQYTDDAGQPYFMYDPYSEHWYDKIEVYIFITNNGENVPPQRIQLHELTYQRESQTTDTVHAFSFTHSGEYELEMVLRFSNSSTNWTYIIDNNVTTIRVKSVSEAYDNAYQEGYLAGYNSGYGDGVNSDDEWTVISFLNFVVSAPFLFVRNAFDFEAFGVNVASVIQFLFIVLLVGFVVFKIIKGT